MTVDHGTYLNHQGVWQASVPREREFKEVWNYNRGVWQENDIDGGKRWKFLKKRHSPCIVRRWSKHYMPNGSIGTMVAS